MKRSRTLIVILDPVVDTSKASGAPSEVTTGDVRVDGVDKTIVSEEADALEPGKWYISIANWTLLQERTLYDISVGHFTWH